MKGRQLYIFLGAAILLGVSLLLISTLLSRKISNPDKAVVGKRVTMSDFKKKAPYQDLGYSYSYASPLLPRDNTVITDKESTVIFKRTVFLAEKKTLPQFSLYQQRYGEPEKIIQGTAFYGPDTSLVIYASKGVAVIMNDFTKEVYEEHLFEIQSVDSYMQTFGENYINSYTPHME